MSGGPDSATLSATGEPVDPGRPDAAPHLFLVLQSHNPLAAPARLALQGLDEVLIGRGREQKLEPVTTGGVRRVEVRLNDPWLSSSHACISRVLGRFGLDDGGSKNGSFVNGAQHTKVALSDGDLIELGHSFFLFREAMPCDQGTSPIVDAAAVPGFATLVPTLRAVFERLGLVARSGVSVILEGETGTGKEVIARAIHQISHRSGSFVAVNCGALPRDLIEAELFGHKRGAFSGATEDRPGLLRSAEGGTLLLDEVGDLPLAAQTVLLRALQEREVRPVGGARSFPIDIRVVAATHRRLDDMVVAGDFRADLFARLAGHRVSLPPLRSRKEDLGLLVAAILRRIRGDRAADARFQPSAARCLLSYDWPGNIRELEKCITTALVLAGSDAVDVSHLPDAMQRAAAGASASRQADDTEQKERLVSLLRDHKGNLSAVSRALGKARVQVQRWVKRYRLDVERFRR